MKNKPLWAFLIGLFVGLSIVFLNSCGKQVNEPSTKTLTIEYDHQERAWIDPNPDEFSNALSRAGISPSFIYDDDLLPNEYLFYDPSDPAHGGDSLTAFFWEHCISDTADPSQPMYDAYFCTIVGFKDRNGNILWDIWATSTYQLGASWFSYVALPTVCMRKTFIHECGHNCWNLNHLCYDPPNDSLMNWLDHNDSACVMGKGRVAKCTGKDMCEFPRFCDRCIQNIRNSNYPLMLVALE